MSGPVMLRDMSCRVASFAGYIGRIILAFAGATVISGQVVAQEEPPMTVADVPVEVAAGSKLGAGSIAFAVSGVSGGLSVYFVGPDTSTARAVVVDDQIVTSASPVDISDVDVPATMDSGSYRLVVEFTSDEGDSFRSANDVMVSVATRESTATTVTLENGPVAVLGGDRLGQGSLAFGTLGVSGVLSFYFDRLTVPTTRTAGDVFPLVTTGYLGISNAMVPDGLEAGSYRLVIEFSTSEGVADRVEKDIAVGLPVGESVSVVDFRSDESADNPPSILSVDFHDPTAASGEVVRCGLVMSAMPGSTLTGGMSLADNLRLNPTGGSFPGGRTPVYCSVSVSDAFSFNVDRPPSWDGVPVGATGVAASATSSAVVTWTPPVAVAAGGATITGSTHAPGDIFPVGVTTVTYTATADSTVQIDAAGTGIDAALVSTVSFDVTVVVNAPPVITGGTVGGEVLTGTLPVNGEFTLSWPREVTATDDFDSAPVLSYAASPSLTQVGPQGAVFEYPGHYTITVTATDSFGASSSMSFEVDVDRESEVTGRIAPDGLTVNQGGFLEVSAGRLPSGVAGSMSIALVSGENRTVLSGDDGLRFTTEDTADAKDLRLLVPVDLSPGRYRLSIQFSPDDDEYLASTAIAVSGDSSSAVLIVQPDTTAPVISGGWSWAPGEGSRDFLWVSIPVDRTGMTGAWDEVTATDAGGPDPDLSCASSPGVAALNLSRGVFPRGTHTVTCTATDASGNTSSISFEVRAFQITELTDVSIVGDDNIFVTRGETFDVTASRLPSGVAGDVRFAIWQQGVGTTLSRPFPAVGDSRFTDADSGESLRTFRFVVPDDLPVGTYTVALEFLPDDSPHYLSAQRLIRGEGLVPAGGGVHALVQFSVVDIEAPVMSGGWSADEALEVTIPSDTSSYQVSWDEVTAVDDVDLHPDLSCVSSPEVAGMGVDGALFTAPGDYAVVCTATDASDNSSSLSFDVNVFQTVDVAIGITSGDSVDEGGDIGLSMTRSPGGVVGVPGIRLVSVEDGSVSVELDPLEASVVGQATSFSATDSAEGSLSLRAVVPSSMMPGLYYAEGTLVVEGSNYIVNSGQSVSRVMVIDNDPPVLSGGPSVASDDPDQAGTIESVILAGQASVGITWDTVTATDNRRGSVSLSCQSSLEISEIGVSGAVFSAPGRYLITCTATDSSENAASVYFEVSVTQESQVAASIVGPAGFMLDTGGSIPVSVSRTPVGAAGSLSFFLVSDQSVVTTLQVPDSMRFEADESGSRQFLVPYTGSVDLGSYSLRVRFDPQHSSDYTSSTAMAVTDSGEEQGITVANDVTGPVLSLPDGRIDVALEPTYSLFEPEWDAVTAADDFDLSPAIECTSPEAVYVTLGWARFRNSGSYEITCTATDYSGNTATGSFTVWLRRMVTTSGSVASSDTTVAVRQSFEVTVSRVPGGVAGRVFFTLYSSDGVHFRVDEVAPVVAGHPVGFSTDDSEEVQRSFRATVPYDVPSGRYSIFAWMDFGESQDYIGRVSSVLDQRGNVAHVTIANEAPSFVSDISSDPLDIDLGSLAGTGPAPYGLRSVAAIDPDGRPISYSTVWLRQGDDGPPETPSEAFTVDSEGMLRLVSDPSAFVGRVLRIYASDGASRVHLDLTLSTVTDPLSVVSGRLSEVMSGITERIYYDTDVSDSGSRALATLWSRQGEVPVHFGIAGGGGTGFATGVDDGRVEFQIDRDQLGDDGSYLSVSEVTVTAVYAFETAQKVITLERVGRPFFAQQMADRILLPSGMGPNVALVPVDIVQPGGMVSSFSQVALEASGSGAEASGGGDQFHIDSEGFLTLGVSASSLLLSETQWRLSVGMELSQSDVSSGYVDAVTDAVHTYTIGVRSDLDISVNEGAGRTVSIPAAAISSLGWSDTSCSLAGFDILGFIEVSSDCTEVRFLDLDYESEPSLRVPIEVTSGDNVAIIYLGISLVNVHEGIELISPGNIDFALVSAANNTVVARVMAKSLDNATLSYRFSSADSSLSIDRDGYIRKTGDLSEGLHSVSVIVSDGIGASLVESKKFFIYSSAFELPRSDAMTFSVSENAASGTVVGSVASLTPIADLRREPLPHGYTFISIGSLSTPENIGDVIHGSDTGYAITEGNQDGAFSIDDEGIITVDGGLDHELEATRELVVMWTNEFAAYAIAVTVNVTDVDEQVSNPIKGDLLIPARFDTGDVVKYFGREVSRDVSFALSETSENFHLTERGYLVAKKSHSEIDFGTDDEGNVVGISMSATATGPAAYSDSVQSFSVRPSDVVLNVTSPLLIRKVVPAFTPLANFEIGRISASCTNAATGALEALSYRMFSTGQDGATSFSIDQYAGSVRLSGVYWQGLRTIQVSVGCGALGYAEIVTFVVSVEMARDRGPVIFAQTQLMYGDSMYWSESGSAGAGAIASSGLENTYGPFLGTISATSVRGNSLAFSVVGNQTDIYVHPVTGQVFARAALNNSPYTVRVTDPYSGVSSDVTLRSFADRSGIANYLEGVSAENLKKHGIISQTYPLLFDRTGTPLLSDDEARKIHDGVSGFDSHQFGDSVSRDSWAGKILTGMYDALRKIWSFATTNNAGFRAAMSQIYGSRFSGSAADDLVTLISYSRMPLPHFVALDSGLSGSFRAAYTPHRGGVSYISSGIVDDSGVLKRVILEQIGYHLDVYLGGSDAPGDEGKRFAQAVSSARQLSQSEMSGSSSQSTAYFALSGLSYDTNAEVSPSGTPQQGDGGGGGSSVGAVIGGSVAVGSAGILGVGMMRGFDGLRYRAISQVETEASEEIEMVDLGATEAEVGGEVADAESLIVGTFRGGQAAGRIAALRKGVKYVGGFVIAVAIGAVVLEVLQQLFNRGDHAPTFRSGADETATVKVTHTPSDSSPLVIYSNLASDQDGDGLTYHVYDLSSGASETTNICSVRNNQLQCNNIGARTNAHISVSVTDGKHQVQKEFHITFEYETAINYAGSNMLYVDREKATSTSSFNDVLLATIEAYTVYPSPQPAAFQLVWVSDSGDEEDVHIIDITNQGLLNLVSGSYAGDTSVTRKLRVYVSLPPASESHIDFVIAFNSKPVFTTSSIDGIIIDPNADEVQSFGRISATDADQDDTITYYLDQSDIDSGFAIDSSAGQISYDGLGDLPQHITVTASDQHDFWSTRSIRVYEANTHSTVNENYGDAVANLEVIAGQSGTVTLGHFEDEYFRVTSNSIYLTDKAKDYESSFPNIMAGKIYVSNSDSRAIEGNLSVTILDVNEPPAFLQDIDGTVYLDPYQIPTVSVPFWLRSVEARDQEGDALVFTVKENGVPASDFSVDDKHQLVMTGGVVSSVSGSVLTIGVSDSVNPEVTATVTVQALTERIGYCTAAH